MRKIFYDCWLVKIILAPGFSTSMLFGAICTKKDSVRGLSESAKRHESCHCEQYWEVTLVAFLLALILSIIFGISWWVMLVPAVYYVLYFLEAVITWCVRLVSHGWKEAFDLAYDNSMFEQEARLAEDDVTYNEYRSFWGFLRFFGRI